MNVPAKIYNEEKIDVQIRKTRKNRWCLKRMFCNELFETKIVRYYK